MRWSCHYLFSALLVLALSGAALAQSLHFDFNPEHMNPVHPGDKFGGLEFVVERAAGAPQVEASPEDPAWKRMAELTDFGIADPPTAARLVYDDHHLYLLVRCQHDPNHQPLAQARSRDYSMRGDEYVHFIINPAPGHDVDYIFKVNMAGSIYDARGTDVGWNPEWRHAVRQEEDAWYVEAALPWEIFGLAGPPARLGFNVGRSGNGVIIRSWNNLMHYSAAASALVLKGVEPEESGTEDAVPFVSSPTVTVQGDSLVVDLPRADARPEDRWIDATLYLRPVVDLVDTRLEARLYPLGGGEVIETVSVVPDTDYGRFSVDLRSHGLSAAEVTLEYIEGDRRTSVARMFLSARSVGEALAGRRVEIGIDLPAGRVVPQGWPLTFGMPFPRGSLWDASNLRLVDGSGREIPSQSEVTAYWAREGAIQWVRFDAVVNPEQGCFVEAVTPSVAPEVPVSIERHDGRLVLNSGSARYVLGLGVSPVEEVWLGALRVASSEGARGLYVIDRNDRLGVSSADGMDMIVEAEGPVAASVRFEGWYRDADGNTMARHITRVEAFADQPFAHVTHTLIITEDTNEVWFKEVGWEFSVFPGAGARAVFNVDRADPSRTVFSVLEGGDAAYMFQEEHTRFGAGENRFRVVAGGDVLHEGEECGDWALLTGDAGGLLISCKEAARQHPKEFELTSERFTLRLFSGRAGEEMDFRGATLARKWNLADDLAAEVAKLNPNAMGWSKTHELLLAPVPNAGAERKAAQYAGLRSQPLYALADPQWIFESDALGPVHPRDRERYPEIERMIDDLFARTAPRGHETGHYGFMDYFAGPTYGGSGYCVAGRYVNTYGLRNSIWLAYARSGERAVREFAEGTNKAFLDNYLIHWAPEGEVRGVYRRFGPSLMSSLPFYWRPIHSFDLSGTTNLDQFRWLYYLTGYRRARDALEQFSAGLARSWQHDRRGPTPRVLMGLRVLTQTYGFTWDPRLRALAAGTFDSIVDWETEVMLTKNRPYQITTYKTSADLRALVEAWYLFGEPKYRKVALAVAGHWWRRSEIGRSPVRREPSIGHGGRLLYEETGDPAILTAMDFALRRAGRWSGPIGASMWCSVFETLPYVMGSLALAGDEHRAAPLPWVAYRDYSGEASVVAQKTSHGILDFTIATIRQSVAGSKEPAPLGQKLILESVGESGQGERAMDQVFQIRSGTTKARVPKDAPAGAYRVLPADPGEHVVMVHARNPTVLHAPGYWHLPDLAPGPRIYFKLPADARNARIFFEGRAKLFTPDGSAFGEVEGARGWIDLPQDKPGLWSFEPIENRLVRVRNIPPFFAFGGPEFYFEPPIAWEREEPVAPEPDGSEDALFVLGAIKEEGSRALRLTGRRTFKLEAGAPHLSGDGGQYLPHKEGTIEFWFRPEWSTFDLGTGAVSKRFINVMTSADTWSLLYRVDPNGTDINLGPRDPSHSLYGAMRVSREADPRRGPALHRSWLTETLFERGEWTHVVWSWGPEIVSGPRMERLSLMTMRIFVNGVGARSVVMRSAVDGIPVGVPESLHILPIEGSIDQFRISDVQRYTEDFAPPSRAKPFEADEHTRALFHFNGTLEGVGYGLDAPPTGVVTPSPSRE